MVVTWIWVRSSTLQLKIDSGVLTFVCGETWVTLIVVGAWATSS